MFQQPGSAPASMATNTLFPEFKTTGDDKHDIEEFIEDLTDYCVMQNWFDPSKDTEAAKWTKPDKAMACLRTALSPAARAVYKYSLGVTEDDQKKPHMVLNALREYYDASIGVSGERQKFIRLLQNENESIASWETRVRNQSAQCEYENFADEVTRDQFIAGLTSEALRVKLIGKGHRHRDNAQTKVTLREVVEVAKAFEATTFANKLMKTARNTQGEQVNQHLQVKALGQHRHCVTGAAAVINSPANSIAQHLARDATGAALLVISPELVEEEQDGKDGISNQIFLKMIQAKKRSLRTVKQHHSMEENSLLTYTSFKEGKLKL